MLAKTYTQDYLINALTVQDPSTLSYVLNRTHAFSDGINLTGITDGRTAPGGTPAAAANSYSYPGTNNKLASIAQGATTVRSFSYDGAGGRAASLNLRTFSTRRTPASLAAEPGRLKEDGIELELLGFGEDGFDRLLDGLKWTGSSDDEDEVPEAPAQAVTRPGDVWLLGLHRWLCGDATLPTDVERLLDGARPHLMVTDPPYGVEYDPN